MFCERAFGKRLSAVEGKRVEMLAPGVQATTIGFSVSRVLVGVNGSRSGDGKRGYRGNKARNYRPRWTARAKSSAVVL